MKSKHVALILCALFYAGCAGQTFSPKDAAAYASAAHTVIGNGLDDYKKIAPLIQKK